ncbi:MAG: nucleoside phosphorylase [Deltaproteobacteria bacterium]|nr:nucleoside phosphorylase [Deltaproteobacteria bacterium]HDZ89532.1 hypothetical protein [Deltaproteobacteria bacterium]
MENDAPAQGIIRPLRGKGEPRLGPDALMVMVPGELRHLVRKSGAEEVKSRHFPLFRMYRTGRGPGQAVTLAGPFIGAPHAVMGLEKLIVLGVKRILVLGWCGSLQPHLKIGALVIPESALSEEGTSQHYPLTRGKPVSDPDLNRAIETSLKGRGLGFTRGRLWTTDAIYRETPEKVVGYRKRGVLAVEMEFSALLTVAAFRSVSLAGLLVVSDELFELRWRPGFSDPLLRENTRLAGEILLGLSQDLTSLDPPGARGAESGRDGGTGRRYGPSCQ